MLSLIGTALATRRMQTLDILHYYVLCTLFPLPDYLDDQLNEFLELWMAYLDFKEFPDLIKYFTTIENGTILKEKCTTMENHTHQQFHVPYPTIFLRGHSQPNPTNVQYTNIVVKNFLHYCWPVSYPIQFLGH